MPTRYRYFFLICLQNFKYVADRLLGRYSLEIIMAVDLKIVRISGWSPLRHRSWRGSKVKVPLIHGLHVSWQCTYSSHANLKIMWAPPLFPPTPLALRKTFCGLNKLLASIRLKCRYVSSQTRINAATECQVRSR